MTEAVGAPYRLYIQVTVVLLLLLALYMPILARMTDDWMENDNYSHGFLVPLISAYLIYSLRDRIRSADIRPSNAGLLLIIVGLLQLLLANVASEYFMQRTSLIVVLFGLSMFLLGKQLTKVISVPLLYLLFMIPLPAIIWNKIAFPLQIFASNLAAVTIQTIGIPVYREGNVLHLVETSLEVVDACSGLRSLVSMLALGAAFAFLLRQPLWKKWVLFLSAFPIAIALNIVRLTVTAVLASHYGSAAAQGFLHDTSGLLVFVLGIALLVGTQRMLVRIRRRGATSQWGRVT